MPRERSRPALEPERRILRVLLLVARTSDAGWIDPRVGSLTPLVAALAPLATGVRRLAWTSVETFGSAAAVLQDLGAQLVAGFAVARFGSLEEAQQVVERALRDRPVLLLIDNFESVAADPDPALVPMLAALVAVGETRVLVTGREPAPTGLGAVELGLGSAGPARGADARGAGAPTGRAGAEGGRW